MKKTFLSLVTLIWVVNIAIPFIYYLVFGFKPIYFDVEVRYVYLGALVSTIVLLLLFALLKFLPLSNAKASQEMNPVFAKSTKILFWLSVGMNLLSFFLYGGFASILTGGTQHRVLSYVRMFLDLRLLFFIVLMNETNKEKASGIIFYSFIYLAISLVNASRSGAFWIIVFLLIALVSNKTTRPFRKRMARVFIALVIVSPFLFFASSVIRYGSFNIAELSNQIIGRVSYLEVSGIELKGFLTGNYDASLFSEKFDLAYQIKQGINQILPGSPFGDLYQANRYWRAIFQGYQIPFVEENYMSMFSIFPVYCILKYGWVFGIIVATLILLSVCIGSIFIKNKAFSLFLGTYFLYTVFQFFDWSYHLQDLLYFVLTFIVIKLLSKLLSRDSNRIGKNNGERCFCSNTTL